MSGRIDSEFARMPRPHDTCPGKEQRKGRMQLNFSSAACQTRSYHGPLNVSGEAMQRIQSTNSHPPLRPITQILQFTSRASLFIIDLLSRDYQTLLLARNIPDNGYNAASASPLRRQRRG